MTEPSEILKSAQESNLTTIDEYNSKQLLAAYGIPVVKEGIARDWEEIKKIASQIGYPVVLKLCNPEITHKTEKKLIEIDLRNEGDLKTAFQRLDALAKELGGDLLVQEMVKGAREFVIGMVRDPQFGPCVMFGLGGILTEILHDVSFRVAPIEMYDALEMMKEIKGHKALDAIRGMEAVDREALGQSLIALGNIGMAYDAIKEIDVNPMIIKGDKPIAVDALIVLDNG
ncbi:acetate--CoA ligase family protein [Thermodesulfobacteriota bacterium]